MNGTTPWQCAFCIFINEYSSNVCGICGQHRRPTNHSATNSNSWNCSICAFVNDSASNICEVCHGNRKTSNNDYIYLGSVLVGGNWKCGVCTLHNEPDSKNCSACGCAKSSTSVLVREPYREEKAAALPFLPPNQVANLDKIENHPIMLGSCLTQRFDENENDYLTENGERFVCSMCYSACEVGEGVVLQNCYHRFCKCCLRNALLYDAEMEFKCPYSFGGYICRSVLRDREINTLLNYHDNGEKKAANRNPTIDCVDIDIGANHDANRWSEIDYQEMIELERKELITNIERFECSICFTEHGPGEGAVMRDCLHVFCRDCLKQAIQCNEEAEMKCPFGDGKSHCDSVLQDREIKALVDAEIYEKYLSKSIKEAESKIKNTFHCKTVDCVGWCIYEEDVTQFYCPVCRKTNCINCKVIHAELDCKQYQEKVKREMECNAENAKSENMLEEMVKQGNAMSCPTCEIILTKITGCDWLRCSMCKTEICWATRGPRWGPKGYGDTTGGCRCRVNRKPCHPQCGNCH